MKVKNGFDLEKIMSVLVVAIMMNQLHVNAKNGNMNDYKNNLNNTEKASIVKNKLRARLLQIPMSYKAFRETHRLASDIGVKASDIEPLLEDLCQNKILIKKIEYLCPTCRENYILSEDDFEDIGLEDNCFECDNCLRFVDITKNKSGYVYFDIKDKMALERW